MLTIYRLLPSQSTSLESYLQCKVFTLPLYIICNQVFDNITGVAAINHFRAYNSGGSIVVTASQASLHPFAGEPL